MSLRRGLLSLIATGALSASLCAQTKTEDARASTLSPEATLNPRPPTALFAQEKAAGSNQLVVYFVVLLALAGGGFYLVKRGLPLRGVRVGDNRLKVLETKMLGNRQFLVVVRYEDSKLLLGVGPGQIQLLCPLDSADEDLEKLTHASGLVGGPETV